MPIYEYYCDDCDKSHEVSQRITDKRLEKCPVCASPRIRKLVSLSSFHLKGSGWYVTDYAGKNPGNGNGHDEEQGESGSAADTDKCKDSDSSNSSKSEAKPSPDSKSESKQESKPKGESKSDATASSST